MEVVVVSRFDVGGLFVEGHGISGAERESLGVYGFDEPLAGAAEGVGVDAETVDMAGMLSLAVVDRLRGEAFDFGEADIENGGVADAGGLLLRQMFQLRGQQGGLEFSEAGVCAEAVVFVPDASFFAPAIKEGLDGGSEFGVFCDDCASFAGGEIFESLETEYAA